MAGGLSQPALPSYLFLPDIEVDFVPEKSGVLIIKKAHAKSPVEKVYGILEKHEKTDDYIEAIRGY
jgi:hypothetical protein